MEIQKISNDIMLRYYWKFDNPDNGRLLQRDLTRMVKLKSLLISIC